MKQVTLENVSSWFEWSTLGFACTGRMIRCAVPSSYSCHMFMLSAGEEAINLSVHRLIRPIDWNNSVGTDDVDIVCAVDDVWSWIGN